MEANTPAPVPATVTPSSAPVAPVTPAPTTPISTATNTTSATGPVPTKAQPMKTLAIIAGVVLILMIIGVAAIIVFGLNNQLKPADQTALATATPAAIAVGEPTSAATPVVTAAQATSAPAVTPKPQAIYDETYKGWMKGTRAAVGGLPAFSYMYPTTYEIKEQIAADDGGQSISTMIVKKTNPLLKVYFASSDYQNPDAACFDINTTTKQLTLKVKEWQAPAPAPTYSNVTTSYISIYTQNGELYMYPSRGKASETTFLICNTKGEPTSTFGALEIRIENASAADKAELLKIIESFWSI